jgi:hypothetical protein
VRRRIHTLGYFDMVLWEVITFQTNVRRRIHRLGYFDMVLWEVITFQTNTPKV